MFRIKICGVTSVADAQRAFDAGADAIGLNFYPGSSRFVSVEKARSITTEISSAIGVFVNSTADEINQIASEVALQGVQLHGDEPPGLLAEIDPALVLVRAYTLGSHGLAGIAESLNACRRAGRMPAAVLIDAAVEGQFGGTGQTADWEQLNDYPRHLGEIPLALAGGLNPKNIGAAIRKVQPHAVDVASGVESSPGVKDPVKLRSFINAAQAAYEEIK